MSIPDLSIERVSSPPPPIVRIMGNMTATALQTGGGLSTSSTLTIEPGVFEILPGGAVILQDGGILDEQWSLIEGRVFIGLCAIQAVVKVRTLVVVYQGYLKLPAIKARGRQHIWQCCKI